MGAAAGHLQRPAAGTVKLYGRDITTLTEQELRAVKRGYGVTFQHGALFSSLTTIGITVPDNKVTTIVGIVGFMANIAYTIWGTQLSALLSEAEKRDGVRKIDVVVDNSKIDAGTLAAATPAAVTVRA